MWFDDLDQVAQRLLLGAGRCPARLLQIGRGLDHDSSLVDELVALEGIKLPPQPARPPLCSPQFKLGLHVRWSGRSSCDVDLKL